MNQLFESVREHLTSSENMRNNILESSSKPKIAEIDNSASVLQDLLYIFFHCKKCKKSFDENYWNSYYL